MLRIYFYNMGFAIESPQFLIETQGHIALPLPLSVSRNYWQQLGISVVNVKRKLRRLSSVGLSRLHAALLGAYAPMLGPHRLGCFSQLLEETAHF